MMSFKRFCGVLSLNSWIKVLDRFSGKLIYEGLVPRSSKIQDLSFSDSSIYLVYSIFVDGRSFIVIEVSC